MNTLRITTSKLLAVALVVATAFTSCKKDEETVDCKTDATTSDLTLHFDHQYAGEVFALNSPYVLDGVDVKFSRISYYMSNFVGMDDEGGMEMYDGEVFLVDAGETTHEELGEITLGHLHMLDFILGLDSVTNHQDPITADAPLNDPDMSWNWNPAAGYKFVRVDGERDWNNDGTFETFEIHVATDALKRDVSLMVHESPSASGLDVHINVDYYDFFSNVNFSAEELAGTHGDGETTNFVADGAATAFSID